MRRHVRCTGLLLILLAPFASGDGAECDAGQNLAFLQQVLSVASLSDDKGGEQASAISREEAELPWSRDFHEQGLEPSNVRENLAELALMHNFVRQDMQSGDFQENVPEPSILRAKAAELPPLHNILPQGTQPSSRSHGRAQPAWSRDALKGNMQPINLRQESAEASRSHYRIKDEQVKLPQLVSLNLQALPQSYYSRRNERAQPVNRRQEQVHEPRPHYSRQDERAQPDNFRQEQVNVARPQYNGQDERAEPVNLRQQRVEVPRLHYSRQDDRVELPWSRFDLQNSVLGQEAAELPTSRERAERMELPTDSRLDLQNSMRPRQEQAHQPEMLSDTLPSSLVDEPEDPWIHDFIQKDLHRLQQLDLDSAPLDDLEDQRLLLNQLRNDEVQKLRIKQLLGEDDWLGRPRGTTGSSSSSSSKNFTEIDLRIGKHGSSSTEFRISDKTYRILYSAVSYETNLAHMVGTLTFSMLAAFVFSRYFKEWPQVQRDANPNLLTDWSSGMFACDEDIRSCLFACCCLPVVWADNTDTVRYLPFWNAFLLVAVLRAALVWPQVAFLCWCLMTCIFTVFRQFLRRIFGMPGAGDCPGMTWDFVTMCCCTCCLVAQEARHIHTASKLGHAGTNRPMVGQAVQALADQQALQPTFGPQRR